jgi:hypothetical protein
MAKTLFLALALALAILGGVPAAHAGNLVTEVGVACKSPFHLLSAASNNATEVKTSAGQICELAVINTTATVYDLRFYDGAPAPPNCASATGVVWNVPIPGSTTGAGISIPIPAGLTFQNGIGFCLTGAVADNDNTNAATGVAINGTFN